MQITVEIPNLQKFKSALAQSPGIVAKYLNIAIKESIWVIRKNTIPITPVRTGLLSSTFEQEFGSLYGKIYTTVYYAIYVHEGTKPHIIRAKNAKVLANKKTGQVFGKVVHHPGTKANPFLKKGVDKSKTEIELRFKSQLEKAMRDIANKANG